MESWSNTRSLRRGRLATTLFHVRFARGALLSFLAACAGTAPTNPGKGNDTFVVNGNPESPTGAAWTFRETVDGVAYDLTGVLFKPAGSGPFPAVVLSHGSDGNAAIIASGLAPTMVSWGLVCIGTNYTHSSGVPIGAPGSASEVGASQAN